MNILFTSSGRRVALINHFKEMYRDNKISGKMMTADIRDTAPTSFYGDKHFIVPKVSDPVYISTILQICIDEDIKLVIPLIDNELLLLSNYHHLFKENGIVVMVSGPEVNEISADKNKTFEFFIRNNISTPKTFSNKELNDRDIVYPLLIKPSNGSSSKDVTKVNNLNELEFFKNYIPNAIVQEYIEGVEFTIDVMVDRNKSIKAIVPRIRIETRAGEVSKGMTLRDKEVILAVEKLVKKLPDPFGCLTIQCFKKEDGSIVFIEINPRFGGGIPLSIHSGANFPLWTYQLAKGSLFSSIDNSWEENVLMLRFDDAIYKKEISYVH